MGRNRAIGGSRRGPTRNRNTEEDIRLEWWLREYGRFPTRDELIAIREYKEMRFEFWAY